MEISEVQAQGQAHGKQAELVDKTTQVPKQAHKARHANGLTSSGPPWEAYEIDLRLIRVLRVGHGSKPSST